MMNDKERLEIEEEQKKRKEVFEDLCRDPDYPCRDCKRCPEPIECRLLCKIWKTWFAYHWRGLRRAAYSFRK